MKIGRFGSGLVRGLFGELPVGADFFVELLPALFGKKDASALQFDAAASARNVFGEPVGPFDVEVDVVGAPNDERRSFQSFQAVFDSERVLIVEGGEKALQIMQALFAAKEWAQIYFDGVVAYQFRMFVSRAESSGRAIDVFVVEDCLERSAQAACGSHGEERFEGVGRPVIVRVAVGKNEAANAFGIKRGENLRNAAAAVVADKVHLIDVQGVEKFLEHLCVCGDGNVLVRRDFGVAMGKEIDGNATADVGQIGELVMPEVAIQQDAVNEERNRSRALFGVTDGA